MKDVDPVIGYPEPFSGGDFYKIAFDQPTGGYIPTTGQAVSFQGKALKKVGNRLTVVVEHQVYGCGYEKAEEFEVPFARDGNAFSFEVRPQKDTSVSDKGHRQEHGFESPYDV
jgi:hypothetical protein